MSTLHLVPLFFGSYSAHLRPLAERLERAFDLTVKQHPPTFDPETAFDPGRGQYNSRRILELLLDGSHDDADKILGVASVDLFVPVLTFVFGEAQLGGRAAVVSVHRLDPAVYGLPADDRLVADRLVKEAVHELGHTYGLIHCHKPSCVMHASTYPEEIDAKSADLCGQCAAQVRLTAL